MMKNGYNVLILVCLIVGGLGHGYAQLPSAMNLEKVIQSTLSIHPSVQARRFDIQAARRGLRAAQGLFDLRLGGTLDIADDLVTIPNPLEMGARTPIETQRYSAEVTVSQPLRWGTTLAFGIRQSQIETTNPFRNCVPGIVSDQCFESTLTLSLNQPLLRGRSSLANMSEERGAKFELSRTKSQLKVELNQQAQQIASLYLQLTLAQAQLKLDQQHLKLIEKRLAETQQRIEMGLLAQSEIYSLRAAKAQRAQNVRLTKSRVEEGKLSLKEFCQISIETVRFPREWFTPARINGALSHLSKRSWSRSPQVIALTMGTKQLKVRKEPLYDAEKSQFDVGLVWSQSGLGEELSDALGTLPDNDSRFYGVSLNYTQAISSRAEEQSAQLEAQIQSRQAEKRALIQRLQLSWTRVLSQLRSQHDLLSFAHDAERASTLSAEAANARFQEGRGTLFEILELQNQAFTSQTQVIVIEHEIAQKMIEIWTLNDEILDLFGVEIDE